MLEEEVFKRYKFDNKKLIKYGFKKDNNKYIYSTNFLNNAFKVNITVEDNKINGEVIDLEFNDKYDAFRVNNVVGEFVNNVKEEYIKVLEDIKLNCCISNYFIYDQTNRISKLIYDKYNISPEFLFDDKSIGVFRNKDNLKWFGIIMNIKRSKLDNGSGNVDVINIKLDPDEIVDLLHKKGFYKAYHMNKKSWISIVLDNTLDDNNIFELICKSYDNVSKKVKK